MTGGAAQVVAAAAAVKLREQLARDHGQSAAARPGIGALVALPSVPSSLGAVVGEAYQVPESTPALRPLGLQPKNQQDACGGGLSSI